VGAEHTARCPASACSRKSISRRAITPHADRACLIPSRCCAPFLSPVGRVQHIMLLAAACQPPRVFWRRSAAKRWPP
jgi:hypothetical protein